MEILISVIRSLIPILSVNIITDNEDGPLYVITVIRDERKENIKEDAVYEAKCRKMT